MKDLFESLDEKKKEILIKAPVLLSIMAATSGGEVDKVELKDAIDLSHLRTFTAPESLQSYYRDVEKEFEFELDNMLNDYSPFDQSKQDQMKKKLEEVKSVIKSLDNDFGKRLNASLNSYARHVSESHKNFLYNIIFPVEMPTFNE